MRKMNSKRVRVLGLLGIITMVVALVGGCAGASRPPPPSEQPTVPPEEKPPELETAGIAGTYVREHYSDEYLNLHEDGTFHLHQMEGATEYDATGEWEVEGNELKLYVKSVWFYGTEMVPAHVVATVEIKGNRLIDPDGEAWVKKQHLI